jgi:hypothetical protein
MASTVPLYNRLFKEKGSQISKLPICEPYTLNSGRLIVVTCTHTLENLTH